MEGRVCCISRKVNEWRLSKMVDAIGANGLHLGSSSWAKYSEGFRVHMLVIKDKQEKTV
jgi:hypothetical protein